MANKEEPRKEETVAVEEGEVASGDEEDSEVEDEVDLVEGKG